MTAPQAIDRDSATPLYEQIAANLRRDIRSGLYSPGKHLPSEADLSAQYGVSDRTARAAVRVLVAEGLARVVTAKGAYVADPLPAEES